MIETFFRDLTTFENELISHLLSQGFPGRDDLADQLAHSRVRRIDENDSLEIQTDPQVKASAVKSRVPTEGEAEDSDGITIHFLLHVVNGTVAELEVYKEDNSRVVTWPSVDTIRVFAPN